MKYRSRSKDGRNFCRPKLVEDGVVNLWFNDCWKMVLCSQLSLATGKITDVQGLLCIHWMRLVQSLSSTSSCLATTVSTYATCKILIRFLYPGALHLVTVISRYKSAIVSNIAIFSESGTMAQACQNIGEMVLITDESIAISQLYCIVL